MKKNYWRLMAILLVAMLSVGLVSCGDDEVDAPEEGTPSQPEEPVDEGPKSAVFKFGNASIKCDNAYYRKDLITLDTEALHTVYFTAADMSKPWSIPAKYDQIGIHFRTSVSQALPLDTVINLTLWAMKANGDLILSDEEAVHLKFSRDGDLTFISVTDVTLSHSELGKDEVSLTFYNKVHPFTAEEKTAASEGRYNLCFYNLIEQPAEFPGGNEAFPTWLSQNVKYPAVAQEQGIQGSVKFNFTVGKSGYLEDIEVMRSPDPSLTEEVVRLLNMSPRWRPAMQAGRFIRQRYSSSINFSLS